MMYFSPSCSCKRQIRRQHGPFLTTEIAVRPFGGATHILPDDGAEAGDPQDAGAAHLVDEQALAGEDGLAEALALVFLDDALGGGDEGVFAHVPRLRPGQAEGGDVAEGRGREHDLARPRVGRVGHLAAGEEFLHGEFDGAFEGDGWRHGDHHAWEGRPVSLFSRNNVLTRDPCG